MQAFFALVDRMNAADAAARPALEAEIWSRYGVEKALLALDMSQFSTSVRRGGILPFVGLIRRMQVTACPIVESHGGTVVKLEADNLLAAFDDVTGAAAAAVAIQCALGAVPGPGSRPLEVAIGIDFGRILLIPGRDCFGDAVNIAYKLGEDVAHAGEVLLTAAARERLDARFPHPLRPQPVSLSGLELAAWSLTCPSAAEGNRTP